MNRILLERDVVDRVKEQKSGGRRGKRFNFVTLFRNRNSCRFEKPDHAFTVILFFIFRTIATFLSFPPFPPPSPPPRPSFLPSIDDRSTSLASIDREKRVNDRRGKTWEKFRARDYISLGIGSYAGKCIIRIRSSQPGICRIQMWALVAPRSISSDARANLLIPNLNRTMTRVTGSTTRHNCSRFCNNSIISGVQISSFPPFSSPNSRFYRMNQV